MTEPKRETERNFLELHDVAALFGYERQQAENVKARAEGREPRTYGAFRDETVRNYRTWSKEGDSEHGNPHRYANNPMPAAGKLLNGTLIWEPGEGETLDDVRDALRAWFHSRPGHGNRADGQPRAARKPRPDTATP